MLFYLNHPFQNGLAEFCKPHLRPNLTSRRLYDIETKISELRDGILALQKEAPFPDAGRLRVGRVQENFEKAVGWSLDALCASTRKDYSHQLFEQECRAVLKILKAFGKSLYDLRACGVPGRAEEFLLVQPERDPVWDDFLHRSQCNAVERPFRSDKMQSTPGIIIDTKVRARCLEHAFLANSSAKSNLDEVNPLVVMFESVIVNMTPVKGRHGSPFVLPRYDFNMTNPHPTIRDAAYAKMTGKGPCIPCAMVVNTPYYPDYTAKRNPPQLTYVGFEYPDRTCLSYIPVRAVKVLYRPTLSRRESLAAQKSTSGVSTFLDLEMHLQMYKELKRLAHEAFLQQHPNTIFCNHRETLVPRDHVRLEVLVKEERNLKVVDHHTTHNVPLLRTMDLFGKDITGSVLLHMRFTTNQGPLEKVQLRLILFGLRATRADMPSDDLFFLADLMSKDK